MLASEIAKSPARRNIIILQKRATSDS